jgi:hypothetical protein
MLLFKVTNIFKEMWRRPPSKKKKAGKGRHAKAPALLPSKILFEIITLLSICIGVGRPLDKK